MRTDYTVIVTVEHDDDPPATDALAGDLRWRLDLLPTLTVQLTPEVEGQIIDVEVTGSRPWPENPADPKSWINKPLCQEVEDGRPGCTKPFDHLDGHA